MKCVMLSWGIVFIIVGVVMDRVILVLSVVGSGRD